MAVAVGMVVVVVVVVVVLLLLKEVGNIRVFIHMYDCGHRCIKDWVILKFTAFCPLFKSVFLSKGISYKLLDCSILMPSLLWLYGFTISHAHLPRDALSCTLREHALTINPKCGSFTSIT